MSRCRFDRGASRALRGFARALLIGAACSGFTLQTFGTERSIADAAERSDRERLAALLRSNADVNSAQADGMTALHWAAHLNDVAVVKQLLAAKADAKAVNRFGVTPLSLACQNADAQTVKLLLDHGADPNTTLRGGETALITAARAGKPGAVKELLARNADVNAKERKGQTALMWAAAEGHAEVVELLLSSGADARVTLPDSGFTAFHFAVRDGRLDAARALLNAGVDVNEVMQTKKSGGRAPRSGTSALLLAVENGHLELALMLVDAGADPNDQRSGFTPLHAMTWIRKPNRGEDDGDPSPLGSGKLNTLDFVRQLVARGAAVNARLATGKGSRAMYARQGATPFFMAASTADVAYMRLLLELGADPKLTNVDNTTPLIVACGLSIGSAAANEIAGEEPEVLEAAQLLLDRGIEINAVDANGETAMHAAAYKNLPKVVQFLADKGARIETWNKKNKYGWTPLMIAEGHRPGNFKPDAATAAALQQVMIAAGATPPPTAPAAPAAPKGYPSNADN